MPDLDDLCLYRSRETDDTAAPPAEAGAALLALAAADQLPSWALSFYDTLAAAGKGHDPPPTLALVATDAILLAPRFTPRGWAGFLLAEDTAEGQVRAFHPPSQPEAAVWLRVPAAPTPGAVWAAAEQVLPILPPPDGSD